MVTRSDVVQLSHRLFEDYDMDEDGFLSREEVRQVVEAVFNEVCKTNHIDEIRRGRLFTMCDENSDNKLSKK